MVIYKGIMFHMGLDMRKHVLSGGVLGFVNRSCLATETAKGTDQTVKMCRLL